MISLHEEHLFTDSARGVSGAFLKRCRRSGIKDLHFHDLRHEATSRLFEKGLNPVEVATITCHKDTKTLMRYTQLRAADLVGGLCQQLTLASVLRVHRIEAINLDQFRWSGMQRFIHS